MTLFCLDVHVLIQVILYFCIFICGFLVSISVGLIKNGFDGRCVLYGEITYDGYLLSSDTATCDFPIYFGIFGMILAGLFLGLYYVYGLVQSVKVSNYGSKMIVLPLIPLNGILCMMTLVVACILTAGSYQFCSSLEVYNIPCIDTSVTIERFGPVAKRSSIAQGGAWLGFLFYLAQTGLCVLRLYRNRRTDLSHPTDVMTKGKVPVKIVGRGTIL